MQTLGDQLLPALLFLTLGFIVGALVAVFVVDRDREKQPRERKSKEKPEVQPTAPPVDPRLDPLARLYRDRTTGKLLVEIDSKIVTSANELTPEQRKRMDQTSESLDNWLFVSTPLPPVTPAAKSEVQTPAPTPAFQTKPITAATLTPPPPVSTTPKVEPVKPVISLNTQPVEKPRTTNIVEQIDEVLQEMLASTPYAEHRIRISQEPSLGVVVWIGAQHYPGIDNVPDPEIQAIIRAAVKEWEKRSDPTLRH